MLELFYLMEAQAENAIHDEDFETAKEMIDEMMDIYHKIELLGVDTDLKALREELYQLFKRFMYANIKN